MVESAGPPPRFAACGIYLHEWALLALGIGTLGILVVAAGPVHKASVEVAAATALYATALIGLRGPAAWSDRARFVATYWYIVWFFLAVARITPALGTPLRDAQLYALDRALFGGTPAVQWQAYARGWLTELFSAAYLSYFVYLNVAVVHALCQPAACRYRLAAPLVGAYIAGFCGYLLVPAVGPAVALAGDFARSLSGGVCTRINEALVTQGSSVYDVFPSLHVLITCVLLDHDRRVRAPAILDDVDARLPAFHVHAVFTLPLRGGCGGRICVFSGVVCDRRLGRFPHMTPSPNALPGWVAEAARLPLAFAQVREDVLLDLRVVASLGPEARVLMVASGGCTAAALAATGQIASLHLCDINPAQLALARLKLRLLQTAGPGRRLALLGHAPMPPAERLDQVGLELAALDMTPEVFGPVDLWSQAGLDHAGRYEQVFAQLRALLRPYQDNILAVLRACEPSQQAAQVAPDTVLGRALDAALDQALALPNLIALFSAQATRNPVEPFARHFARQTRRLLATLPAAYNPYLWQMYRGCFPIGVTYPWFTAPAPRLLPELRCSSTDMLTALRQSNDGFDYVHLSNILDWLSVEEAGQLLAGAAAALRPGGVVLIRQLNSTLVVPPLGPDFEWLTGEAHALHASDRSFFYRALHLGRRR